MLRVCVGTPIIGQPSMDYAVSLARLCLYFSEHRTEADQTLTILDPAEGCVLPQNRQKLTDDFLAVPGATHLLFIDADMGFDPETLNILAARRLPFVACNYRMKSDEIHDWTSMRKDRKGHIWTGPESNGIEEAWYTGLGFALIERAAIEVLQPPRFHFVWDGWRWLTEDAPFCDSIWRAGLSVHVDHDASKLVRHWGKASYEWKAANRGLAHR